MNWVSRSDVGEKCQMIKLTSRRHEKVYDGDFHCVYQIGNMDDECFTADIRPEKWCENEVGFNLRNEAFLHAERLFGSPLEDDMIERLEYELEHIESSDAEIVFLLMKDISDASTALGYELSSGRAGASLVAYVLGITPINPIVYEIPYEGVFRLGSDCKSVSINIGIPPSIFERIVDGLKKNYGKFNFLGVAPYFYWGQHLSDPQGSSYSFDKRYTDLSIYKDFNLDIIHDLQEATGRKFNDIPYDDKKTLDAFEGRQFEHWIVAGLWERYADFRREDIPRSFEEIYQRIGLNLASHRHFIQRDLIESGAMSLSDALSSREAVMTTLMKHGCSRSEAFSFSEYVRTGRGINMDRFGDMLRSATVSGLPAWFVPSCEDIRYLPLKASVLSFALFVFRTAYYRVHFEDQFEQIVAMGGS